MAHRNALQVSMLRFAKYAKEQGWNGNDTLAVIRAVEKESNELLCKGQSCNLAALLKKHGARFVKAKNVN